jgi:hypothetical protein
MNARFSLGIDLGTSNSAIAVADLESGETRIINIAQVLVPNQIGEMPTLPSAIYIPHREEFPQGSFPLPWNNGEDRGIVGQFARDKGALVPDRLVTSAKSEPDLAVARGGAIYGRHRATGKGIRINAGAARSYYIGLETSMPAIPGYKPPLKALCVVPQGMQEGTELLIEGHEFGLVTGRTAEFRFFSSSVRSGDTPGQILADAERNLEDAGLLEVEIPALEVPVGQVVPVRVNPVVTELGILELWMRHTNSDRRWKVEFQVRTE